MKLLLDTHAFLWFIDGNSELSVNGRTLIEDGRNEKFVSVASIWEIAIKSSLGKLSLEQPLEQFIPAQLEQNGFAVLGISVAHALQVARLPFHHRDPFDRMLAAQSLVENLNLLSNDSALDAYGIKRSW